MRKSSAEMGESMNGKFFDLKKEKQDRIINAALKVFAMQDYRFASTDEIVREASISKGLLFHYFVNKLGVYTFVYQFSVQFLLMELQEAVSDGEQDLFDLILQVEQARLQVMRGYPYMQEFLNRSGQESIVNEQEEILQARAQLHKRYQKIYQQVNWKSLPEGIDGEKLSYMLEITIREVMLQHLKKASFQPEKLYEEITEYVNLIHRLVFPIPR